MEYAVFKSGGKQYKASVGDTIEVDRLISPKDSQAILGEVLMYVSDDIFKVGNPFISGVSVKATVVDQKRGEKIDVSKFKAKARSRRTIGFRSAISVIKIEAIVDSSKKAEKTSKK